MAHPVDMNDPDQLIAAYLDNELEPDQEAELMAWLTADREHQKQFVREVQLHRGLRAAYLVEKAQKELPEAERVALTRPARLFQRHRTRPWWRFWPAFQWRTHPFRTAFASLAVTCLIVVLILQWSESSPTLSALAPGIQLVRNGVEKQVIGQVRLRNGDRVRIGQSSAAQIQYTKEGTRIDLDPGTSVAMIQTKGDRLLRLSQGTVYASVAHQRKGHALVFATPQAEARVIGTELKLHCNDSQTDLEVYEGAVRFSSAAHSTNVDVGAGLSVTIAPEQGLTTVPLAHTTNGILWELWQPVSGNTIRDLTSHSSYPNQPTERQVLDSCEAPTKLGNNGARMRGFLYPPRTGDYVFWIAADDTGELWLSPTESVERKEKICYTPIFTVAREWSKRPEQRSRPIHLIAGRKYYLEALMKQFGGGACLVVAWQGPGISQEVIPGQYLSPAVADQIPKP